MSGITSGTGIFSGINSGEIIDQLLAIQSRPKLLAQKRIMQLQQQQAGYLDLNSKLGALKTAAAAFRLNKVFNSSAANSSDPNVLTATASTSATPGSYQFIVDRLVSTQQFLSRGFSDASTTGLNAGAFTFEPAQARLDRDTSLSELNGGNGISRGKIVITDTTNNRSATIDLSRAATANDVLDAINAAGIDVAASVDGGKFVIKSNTGGNLTVTNAFGSTTATSLGIERATASGATVTGTTVYSLGQNTSLRLLNDGNGVTLNSQSGNARFDFTITVGGTAVNVNIGNKYDNAGVITESASTTMGGVLTRINAALEAGLGNTNARATVGADGASIVLTDSAGRTIEVAENATGGASTAADLGILTSAPQTGTVQGRRILSGLNSTLVRTLNGGAGLTGDGTVSITGRDGIQRTVNVDTNGSIQDILNAFNTHASGAFSATLDKEGTGLLITDRTSGTGNLIIAGTTATSLGIATDPLGVAAGSVDGSNLQHQYLTKGTLLSTYRNGQGVGTGQFRVTDSTGVTAVVTIADTDKTVGDIIAKINSRPTRVKARINSKGDGIELYEDPVGAGSLKIKVGDESGGVAAGLGISGEAAGTGAQNVLDGTQERKVTFAAGDTLQQIASKITAAGVGVAASVVNDGTGSTPFHLNLTAKTTGTAGRFVVDTGGFDLGLSNLDAGNDARVFFGSSDPARAVLLTSSRNTLDSVITGVTIDLKTADTDPVTLTVSRDTGAIETAISTFVDAFNTLTDRIKTLTKYDAESKTRGVLLGDSVPNLLSSALFSTVQGSAIGVSGRFQEFADVGLTIGSGSKLTLDRDRLRAALEEDPQAVADLFAAREALPSGPTQVPGVPGATYVDPNAVTRYTSLGLATQLENLAEGYVNSVTGVLTRRNQVVTDQITFQNKRIADFDIRLATRREILQRQFNAMEEAIARLQTQQSAISQMG